MCGDTTNRRALPRGTARTRHRNRFPENIAPVFDELFQDVAALHEIWRTYLDLFKDTPERIRAFNEAGRGFFLVIRTVLWDTVLLALARLTDPPETGGRANLSLNRLAHEVAAADPALADRLKTGLLELAALCEPIKVQRNRLIAHADLLTRTYSHPKPMKGIKVADVEEALCLVRSTMNAVEEHFVNRETAYERPIVTGDAEHFASFLERAVSSIEREQTRAHGDATHEWPKP